MMRAHAGLVFAGVSTFILMGVGQSLYGPALPVFGRELAISEAQAGMLISAHWVGSAFGIAAMFLFGARVVPRHSLGVMVLGSAGVAAMAGFWPTMAGAVLMGSGFGMAAAVFNPRVLVAFGQRGPSMLSLLNASFGIGAILSPLAFVWMGSDPRLSFGLTSVLCALIWLGAGAAGRVSVQAPGTVRRFRPHLPVLALGAVGIGLEASLIGLGPTALITAGIPEPRAAELLSIFFLLFVAARILLVFGAHLVPPFVMFTCAMALAAGGAGLAALVSPAAGFVAMGVAASLFFPGFYVTATRKMGDDHRVPPTIIASGLVGGILAPLILAPLMTTFGDRSFFWIILWGAALTTVLAVAAMRSINR